MKSAPMEPIAIVGMSCRFPGADSLDSFWQLLQSGEHAIDTVPSDRWDVEAYYSEDPLPGKMTTRLGGFVSDVDKFDPSFFGISPREALQMDPQQRLMLEVAWEALEHSNTVPADLAGSQTGVFIGCGNYDFGVRMAREYSSFDAHLGTGLTVGISANRLSYLLDLRGPSLTVETACSSSLVSLHVACQSLLNGESNLCLVGGTSLMLSPNQSIIYSQAQMLSPDGRCKTFDASANGYVRGEGCGVLVIKRLSDAQQAGDRVLAVVRGTAINQDGRSNGLTAPNGPAQQAVIRQALDRAAVKPNQISYVEAHGTGTPLGDPIEIKSLKAVLGEGRSPENSCWIGSVKTNIGHLEAAAGMAGLIKTVLAMQHREIPAHLNLENLNPYISLGGTAFAIPTERQNWQPYCDTRLAGISSFGFGGTNAHVILEEGTTITENVIASERKGLSGSVAPSVDRSHHLLTLSAKSEAALDAVTVRYAAYLESHPEVALADVCFSASQARSHFNHRLSLVATSASDALEQLQQFQHQMPVGATRCSLRRRKAPKVAFLFTGQGSQAIDMGRQLYERQPSFQATLDQCDRILKPIMGKSLIDLLYAFELHSQHDDLAIRSARLNQTVYTQPALFALEYALAKLWQSWGVEPAVVMGHSVGEYVAACIAGVFSLEDGLKLIAERGKLMQALPSEGAQAGGMAAIFADSEMVNALLTDEPMAGTKIVIAAYNGPENTVVSGPALEIEEMVMCCEQRGIEYRQLVVSHAFHSPAMIPMLADFRRVAEKIEYAQPSLKLISNLTGEVANELIASPDYWCEHISAPVNFAAGINTLADQKCPLLLEVGPRPILLGMAQRCLSERSESSTASGTNTQKNLKNLPTQYLPSLRANREDYSQLLETLGALYANGIDINWQRFDADYPRQLLTLPTYPWQHQRYWVAPTDRHGALSLSASAANSPLGAMLNSGQIQPLLEKFQAQNTFSASELELLPKLLDQLMAQQHQPQSSQQSLEHSHNASVNSTDLNQLLYQLTWQLQARRETPLATNATRSWLILADKGGVGKALSDLFAQRGDRYRLLYANEVTTDPETRSRTLKQSVNSIFENGISPVTDVVFLWSLESRSSGAEDWRDMLSLVHNLASAKTQAKLWTVTHQSTSLEPSTFGILRSPLWGLGKGIALEHPEIWGGLIDLVDSTVVKEEGTAASFAPSIIQSLAAELLDCQGEDQIALRGDRRYVARLTNQQTAQETSPQESSTQGMANSAFALPAHKLAVDEATYLVTGGLGTLGLAIAQWLAWQGAKHLVLTGRRAPSETAKKAIAQLTQSGVTILPLQADVTNRSAMTRAFDRIKRDMPPLKGIVHAAGSASYKLLSEIDTDEFERVLAPKVQGTLVLHELTEKLALDFFVCFSSIASVWGSKGQAHYAAANQFLDSLAHYRRAQNLPALTVNWGPWGGGGMVIDEFETWLARAGITPLPPEKATAALGKLLQQGQIQATVVDIDWARFKALFELRGPKPLLSEITVKCPARSDRDSGAPSSEFLQSLQALPDGQKKDRLVAFLQTEVAQVMGLPSGQSTPLHQGFFEMGLDSLMAVELKTRLETCFACDLPGTLIFEVPTVCDLAEYLADNVLGWAIADGSPGIEHELLVESSANRTGSENPELQQEAVEQMSETELEDSITEQLARLESLVGGQ